MKTVLTLNTGRQIGVGHASYIIAEVGSNHDGSLEKAKKLIELAHQTGADAVKFQSFQAQSLINRQSLQNGQWQPHPAWDILEKLTLPTAWHPALSAHAKQVGIDFFSAPFDLERVSLLAQLDVPLIKVASGDLTYFKLLRAVAHTGKPVILSTGMAYLGEVEAAINVLADAGCQQVALLHCVSLYPPSFSDANIRAMVTMREAFQVPVGYSDHTPGSVVPLGAVALGATIIEKHLTDNKANIGPDHPYALDVPEFTAMVSQIRQLEKALGDGLKRPAAAEVSERVGARRAVYASHSLKEGQILQASDLLVVRHAYEEGVPASDAEQIIGQKLCQDVPENRLITRDMLRAAK